MKKLPYNTIEDMYAAIGYGGFTAQKAVTRISEELARLKRQQDEKTAEEEPAPKAPAPAAHVRHAHSEQGIVVEGLSNCLVKFSKCCTPGPGDEIVGFITRGYGVSVHRADCPNAAPSRRRPEEDARWIKVSWGEDVRESYVTALEVYAKDRFNLVLDISAALSTSQTRVQSLSANILPDNTALIRLSVFVSGSTQLAALMRKLNQISGVMRVERPAG